LLLGGSGTIDQSWSIGIELTFYFMIIILSIIDLRKGLYFCFGASLSYFIAHCLLMKNFQDGYDNGIYKDALFISMDVLPWRNRLLSQARRC
jgi:hypothetical protein